MMRRKWILLGCFGIVFTPAVGIVRSAPQTQLQKAAYLLAAVPQAQSANGQTTPAQTDAHPAPRLAFDVASIKPVAPPYPSGGGPWTINHGKFKAQVASARNVIGWAYSLLGVQVRGGPDWVNRQQFEFDAESDSDATPPQVKLMVQTLFADRFKLVAHRETQVLPVFTLVLGKNGSKIEKAQDGRRPFINWTGPGRVTFTDGNMLGLINILSAVLESPVIDKTGLKGAYNFNLDFTDPRFLNPQSGPSGESDPDLMTAVQEQLGLKLEMQKNPVDILVIDHIEMPSPN